MAVWLQVKVRGRELSLRPIGCTLALSVTQKRRCSCGMRLVALYKCYMLLCFAFVNHGRTKVQKCGNEGATTWCDRV